MQQSFSFYLSAGSEGSGEVIEIGPGVINCSVGDHVAVAVMGAARTSLSSGAYCEQIVVNSEVRLSCNRFYVVERYNCMLLSITVEMSYYLYAYKGHHSVSAKLRIC